MNKATHSWEVAYSRHSSVSGCAESIEQADERARYHIQYYRDMEYPIRSAEVSELCPHCESGKIRKPKSRRPVYITCKHCNGDSAHLLYKIDA